MKKSLVNRSKPLARKDLLGAHFPIAGGLENALETAARYQCIVCQIFTKNANTWRERSISAAEARAFAEKRHAHGIISVAAHTSYLINLAAAEPEISEKSRTALACEMARSKTLGLSFVVLHPGSHKGAGEASGLRRVANAIMSVLEGMKGAGPRLLLETTAGQGNSLGHRFEQLVDILTHVGKPDRMGVCLDTSHIFAAGYDIRTPAAYRETMDRFDALIGLERLKLMHLNDSKKELGTRVDRHAHIGRGCIGPGAFQLIMNDPRLFEIPKILETPKEKGKRDWDAVNLKVLRRMAATATR